MQVVSRHFLSDCLVKKTSYGKPFFSSGMNFSSRDLVTFKHSPQDRAVTKAKNNLSAAELKFNLQALDPFIVKINDKMDLFKKPSLNIKEELKQQTEQMKGARENLAKLNISPDSIRAKGENELSRKEFSSITCYDNSVKKAGFLVASAIELEAQGDDKNIHPAILGDMDELEKNMIPLQEELEQAHKDLEKQNKELFKFVKNLCERIAGF